MKKLLLLACIIGYTFNLNAQCDSTLPISENFSDKTAVEFCWDFIDADGDGYNWFVADLSGNNGLVSESRSSATGGILYPDNWAITYAIDLTPYNSSSNIQLNWKVRTSSWSFDKERYTVYAATGDQIVNFIASPVNIFEDLDDTDASGAWASRSLNISSLAGNMVYIAYRHHLSAAQREIEIDDVVISSSTLGIEDFDTSSFKHFYNTNTDVLTLKSSNSPIDSIEIINLLGQKVVSDKLYKNNETIDLSNIGDGIYIAQITIDDATKTIKFLKQ